MIKLSFFSSIGKEANSQEGGIFSPVIRFNSHSNFRFSLEDMLHGITPTDVTLSNILCLPVVIFVSGRTV